MFKFSAYPYPGPKLKKKRYTLIVGIEPTTIGLKGQRSTFWAKWASNSY